MENEKEAMKEKREKMREERLAAARRRHSVEIGHRTIVFAVLFLVFLLILWQISGILIGLFISFLIMTALNPLVTKLQEAKIPRSVSSLVLLVVILGLLLSGLAALVPPVVEQTGNFLEQLPQLLEELGIYEFDPAILSSQLGSVPKSAFRVLSGLFSNLIAVFMVIVVSFYLLQERGQLAKRLTILFDDRGKEVGGLLLEIETKLGGWVRGQIVLSAAVGVAVYLGLAVVGMPYALPLSIIAGVLEIVPNIGPTISMLPAVIVGFTISPYHGVLVILLYFVIQQLENGFLVPQVMKKVVGLNPLVTLVSLMVGYRLGGALLAVLAIPLVLTGGVLLPYFYDRLKRD